MRCLASFLAVLAALAGCGSEENVVFAGYPGAIISPVRSSMSAQVTFNDANGAHQQWIIALTDGPDLCTKVTAHLDYFQNPPENFVGIILWVPTGNIGTFIVGQNFGGSTVGDEVLIGTGPVDGGMPGLTRLSGVVGVGGNISLTQFDAGPGGEAKGSFDVAVFDPGGSPREYAGKFKATFCPGAANAQLP
jgi:hypothetical protein